MKSRIHMGRIALPVLLMSALAASCGFGRTSVSLLLTDAPVDPSTVKAVDVVISSIALNSSRNAPDGDPSWETLAIDPPARIDLLDLQNGITENLGSIDLRGGISIRQIRLGIDSVSVVEADDSVHPADLPSATGLKVVGNFDIPLSGEIGIAVDFDVRKSVIENSGGYQVKPALRAVIEGEAGRIVGSTGESGAVAVHAYSDGSWNDAEPAANAEGQSYAGAYSSTLVGSDGSFVLAFMDPGIYDLVAVDASGQVAGIIENVAVSSGKTTSAPDF